MTRRAETGLAPGPVALARWCAVALALGLGACGSDGSPDGGSATTGVDVETATATIGTCSLADLSTGRAPGDGAGGRTVGLIAFHNDGPQPCRLTDPVAVATTPAVDPPIERGGLFFPAEKFQGELAPGATAYIEVETTACVTGGGSAIESVAVSFQDDVVVAVPWDVASTCGTRWEGFVSWQ